MIYALVVFTLTMAIKLAIDLKRYQSGKPNRHILGPAIVFTALIACSWLSGWIWVLGWFFTWNAVFDTLWGTLALREPFYIGTTAWLDRLQRKYRVLQVLKYLLAITSIVLYVCTE